MADSSLDDFFAKKDKSKKGKKKLNATEELAKKPEELGKIIEKPKKEKEKSNVTTTTGGVNNLNILDQDENEWKDIDEEKDYSGLRVQALNIKDKEEELREQKAFEIDQENKKEDQGGPWKLDKAETLQEDDTASEIVEEEPAKPEESKPSTEAKRYVPPGMRNAPAGGGGGQAPSRSAFRRGKAPQLDNAEEFPSLGDAAPPELSKDFKPVRHGSRETASRENGPSLSLGNKYNALSTNREAN